MTNDPGNDIRDRFKTTSLPPAPVRLRERLAAVASTPIASTPWFGRARLVVALAAAFAIASIALVAAGGLDDPGPSPSPLTAEATAEVTAEPTPQTTTEPYPFEVVCEEAEAPAFSCTHIVDWVLDALGTSSEAIARIEVSRPCDTPCVPAERTVKFVITFASTHVMDGSLGPGGLWQLLSSQTRVPTECPELGPPTPTCRIYSDD